jgi:hypothetical protein
MAVWWLNLLGRIGLGIVAVNDKNPTSAVGFLVYVINIGA